MNGKTKSHTPVSYGTYIMVWLALMIFTGLTVAVAGMDLKSLSVTTALVIATIKSTLVVAVFMNIKYEKPLFKIFILAAVVTLMTILLLTFSDVLFR